MTAAHPPQLIGAGGGGLGKGTGGGSSRTPRTAKDSLDSRQYATVVDLISEGEIEGLVFGNRSIYLNNVPLLGSDDAQTPNFQDVEVQVRTGTQSQTSLSFSSAVADIRGSSPADVIPVGLTVSKNGPVTRIINDPNVDAVRVSLSVPALQKIRASTGDTVGSKIEFTIEVQYNTLPFQQLTLNDGGIISGRTADEYRRDYDITLNRPNPSDNVSIRVSRLTDDSTSTLLSNELIWASYTEIIKAKLSYPNSALIGLRVDAEQFNSIPSRSYFIKGVKIQIPNGVTVDENTGRIIYPSDFIWDGTFSAAVWCACPAWILWDLLTDSRYGVGEHIDAAQLDRWAFYRASRYCNELVDGEARFSCNVTIQTADDVFKLIGDLLSVMRCRGYWNSGSLTITQDRPELDPVCLFTNANVSEAGFTYSNSSLKTRPNVVVASYLDIGEYDSEGVWRDGLRDVAYEVVEDTESIEKYGVIRLEVEAFGCVSRKQANRYARAILYSERFEKDVVSFMPRLDSGLLVRPGHVVRIADAVKQQGRRGGLVSSATTTTITVDNTSATDLTFTSSSILSVYLSDGTVAKSPIQSVVGSVITLQVALSAAPPRNSVWLLDTPASADESTLWRIVGVQEEDDINYSVSAIRYNPDKYTYIDAPNLLQPRIPTSLNPIPAPPTNLSIVKVGTSSTAEVQYEVNGRVAVKITAGWQGPQGVKNFRVRYRGDDDNFTTVTVQGTVFDILDVQPNTTYTIQVSSVSASNGLYSAPIEIFYTVTGLSAVPANVSGLTLAPISDNVAILTWDEATDLDVRLGGKVIIKHDPRLLATGAEWGFATQVVNAVDGKATQKQVPLLPGTYFLKFEDYLGNRSEVATGFEVKLPQYAARLRLDLYVEEEYVTAYYTAGVAWTDHTLDQPFSGTLTNCVYDSAEQALVITGGQDYAEAGYVDQTYALSSVLSEYTDAGYADPLYVLGELTAEYLFKETLDLGTTYDVNFRRNVLVRSITTGELFDSKSGLFDAAQGLFDGTGNDAVNTVLYIRTTPDDPAATPTWSGWIELINCNLQGRAFQLKAVLSTTTNSTNLAVMQLEVIPELLSRVASNSAPISSSAVAFDAPFFCLNSVTVSPISLQLTERFVLSNPDRNGFTINFFRDQQPIAEDYNYMATGYGRAL